MKFIWAVAIACVPLTSFADGFGGGYFGGVAGYAAASDKGKGFNQGESAANGWTHKVTPKGALYGLAGGYNWILDNNVLLGIEADYIGRGGSTDRSYQKLFGATDTDFAATTKLTSAASVRARLGYLFSSQALVYATAGYATAKVTRKFHDYRFAAVESHSGWQDGWSAGIGMEYLLTRSVSAGVEYRYADYGTKKVKADLWNESYKQRLHEESLRIGVSYRF